MSTNVGRIGIVASAMLLLAACTAAPPSPPAPVPTATTAGAGGVSVTIGVGSRQLLAGDRTSAFLEIHNDSGAEVWFDQDTCLLDEGLSLAGSYDTTPQPTDDPGVALADPRLAWVKTTALHNPVSLIGFRPAAVGDDIRTPITCALDAVRYGLPVGGVIREDEVLLARRTDGLPAWPGTYVAGFTFPTDQPIHVELPLEVVGTPYAGISRGQAIDAALADRRVSAWLYELGKSGIEDGDAWFDNGLWTITVRTTSNGRGTATVDPSGKVTAVSIPPTTP